MRFLMSSAPALINPPPPLSVQRVARKMRFLPCVLQRGRGRQRYPQAPAGPRRVPASRSRSPPCSGTSVRQFFQGLGLPGAPAVPVPQVLFQFVLLPWSPGCSRHAPGQGRTGLRVLGRWTVTCQPGQAEFPHLGPGFILSTLGASRGMAGQSWPGQRHPRHWSVTSQLWHIRTGPASHVRGLHTSPATAPLGPLSTSGSSRSPNTARPLGPLSGGAGSLGPGPTAGCVSVPLPSEAWAVLS